MKKRDRQSQRRSGYDYASPGRYFVTVCTTDRGCLFGQVADGEMVLNDAGRMVDQVWVDIPLHYPGIGVDIVQVMPNHIHGILVIEPVGAGPCARPNAPPEDGRPRGAAPTQVLSLSDVMERFKSLATTRYITGVRNAGWEPFRGRLWQRNYHDRIIRNEQELNRIREYIRDNPTDWESDENHPERQGSQPMRSG